MSDPIRIVETREAVEHAHRTVIGLTRVDRADRDATDRAGREYWRSAGDFVLTEVQAGEAVGDE